MMTCSLCGNDRELRKSHIIPEWVYTDLYDENHRFHRLTSTNKKVKPFEQKGLREKLLCEDCEQRFSRFENYARRILKDGENISVHKYQDKIKITGINYSHFKLFQLSILWRASIAKNEMFSLVDIGPHENIIRTMLLEERAGEPTQYGCLMFGIINEKDVVTDLIDQPEALRIDGMRCYRFIFSGFVWVFFVASHRPNTNALRFMLSEDGDITIYIRPFQDLEYLKCFADNVKTKLKKSALTKQINSDK
jgi:hypothetical protein